MVQAFICGSQRVEQVVAFRPLRQLISLPGIHRMIRADFSIRRVSSTSVNTFTCPRRSCLLHTSALLASHSLVALPDVRVALVRLAVTVMVGNGKKYPSSSHFPFFQTTARRTSLLLVNSAPVSAVLAAVHPAPSKVHAILFLAMYMIISGDLSTFHRSVGLVALSSGFPCTQNW